MKTLIKLLMCLTLILSMITSSFAVGKQEVSIEQVYEIYTELPSWVTLKEDASVDVSAFDTSEDNKDKIVKKRVATLIIDGFETSTEYNKFKAELLEVAYYNQDVKEMFPKENTKKAMDKFESLSKKFNKAMSSAALLNSVGTVDTSKAKESTFGIMLDNILGSFASVVYLVTDGCLRIGLTAMPLRMIIDVMYISFDVLQPLLGSEVRKVFGFWKGKDDVYSGRGVNPIAGYNGLQTKKHRNKWDGVCFASRYAIDAVNLSYRVSDDLDYVSQVSTLFTYFKNAWWFNATFLFIAIAASNNTILRSIISIFNYIGGVLFG